MTDQNIPDDFEPRRPSMAPAIAAVLGMAFLTVAALLLVILLVPDSKDRLVLIPTILGAMAPTTAALLSLIKSNESTKQSRHNTRKLENLTVTVDGRLSKLLEQTAAAENAAGRAGGLVEGHAIGTAAAEKHAGKVAEALAHHTPEPPGPPVEPPPEARP